MRHLLFSLTILLLSINVFGLEPLVIDSDRTTTAIKPYTQFFIDPNNNLTIDNIQQLESSNKNLFENIASTSEVINFGFSTSTIWLRLSVDNQQARSEELYFDFDFPLVDEVTMYHFSNGKLVSEHIEGITQPLTNRLFKSRSLVFPINLDAGEQSEIYFRTKSLDIITLPAKLYSQVDFFEHKYIVEIFLFCIFGLYIGFLCSHFLVYLDNREIVYLSFSAAATSGLLFVLYLSGTAQLFTPQLTNWNNLSVYYCAGLASSGVLWFHVEFLNLRKNSPKIYYFVLSYITILLVGINIGFFVNQLFYFFIAPLHLILPFFICISTIPWLLRGYRPAKIYFYGSIVTLITVLWTNLCLLGVLPVPFNMAIICALGYSISFVIFSYSVSAKLEELSISEQRAQLEAEAAKEKDKTKSEFLANMSHEIRTPLNGVLGMIQLLQKSELKAEQKSWVKIIDSSGKNLLNIVNDILDYSKIEAGKLAVEKIPCDIREIIEDCKDVFIYTTKNDRVKMSTHVDAALPLVVETDPARVKQILVNLIGNAQKFTDSGKISVAVKKILPDDFYRISVSDTGMGIPPGQQEKLFKSFEQTRSDIHRRYGGTGLGLAICKQLAELLGGTIGFKSEEGKGSSFWFDIPLPESEDMSEFERIDQNEAEDLTQLRLANKMSILVAEDNKVNQIVVLNMLKHLGHYCEFVGNGSLAVSKIMAQHDEYDMILMDCDMPIKNGYEATQEIRLFEKENNITRIPIVALTAHAIENLIQKSFDSGMDDHIAKPLSLDKLRSTINQYSAKKNKLYSSTNN